MNKKIFNVSSDRQYGGITTGVANNEQNTVNIYVWKGRREGFWFGVAIAIVAEIIIRIFY